MTELNVIRDRFDELDICFELLDKLAIKIKLNSKKGINNPGDSIIFCDYKDGQEYLVNIKFLNDLLDSLFNEFYFKIVLSGSNFYNKVKSVCFGIEKDPVIFDLFFRSLFFAIKDRDKSSLKSNKQHNRKMVNWLVMRAYDVCFDEIPTNPDHVRYCRIAQLFLDELEKKKLIFYETSDITRDDRFKSYFPTSCDTFRFVFSKRKADTHHCISPIMDFLDLKILLENQKHLKINFLAVLDRTMQTMLLLSFPDAYYSVNDQSDNSLIIEYLTQKNA